jgi:hypothetical protein
MGDFLQIRLQTTCLVSEQMWYNKDTHSLLYVSFWGAFQRHGSKVSMCERFTKEAVDDIQPTTHDTHLYIMKYTQENAFIIRVRQS